MYTIQLYEKYRFGVSKKFRGSLESAGVVPTDRHHLVLCCFREKDGLRVVLPQHLVFHIIDKEDVYENRHKKTCYTILFRGDTYKTKPLTDYAASKLFWNVNKQGAKPKYLEMLHA